MLSCDMQSLGLTFEKKKGLKRLYNDYRLNIHKTVTKYFLEFVFQA